MKLLTLIRHAKSSWADGDLSDFERPLNARGERDAPVMGKRLAAVVPPPDLVLASPAARARRTAELIAAEAGLEASLSFEQTLYLASPDQMLGVAQDQDDSISHLVLVSHNPGTTDLANILADANIQNVPTCGTVRMQLEVDRWRDAAPGRARVLAFDYPKKGA
jgi:phosphohistidine phosphatase